MTSATFDGARLRDWLVDYLITHVGCSSESIDFDASMADLGVGSRDAVVLAGELAELLGRTVSPVDFWQHPTINGLIGFLSAPVPEAGAESVIESPNVSGSESIAVIGLGCRMPGGISDPDGLWDFLVGGRCAVGEVPAERWQPFDDGSPEIASALARTTRWGAFLDDIEGFDADFFDISSREAVKMDPQQRLLLEVAWEALEHAGIPAASLRRSQTGVFAGACFSEYGYLSSTDLPRVDAWSNTGGALSIIANRLSYFLDLRGPSITVDTACSSSLVAVHLACQSLRSGDSNLAMAAGVNLLLSPAVFHGFDQAGALSPTGMCHSFDAAADGFVRGEGCGVVVLKRLPDALRDGDRVLAVVRGSAINQDGHSNGLMAPNPAAQMAVLRTACANAGIEPRDMDYVEAHGTGTFLGDPIEARALGSVMGRGRPATSPLLVGAVKSNLGHLEAAAGVAGFIKTVMALQRGRIPGNVGYGSPNPHIAFDQLRLRVVDREQEWPTVSRARRAGVSSFGFGGTNAHVILEQAPDPIAVEEHRTAPVSTLVVSGKSTERIAATAAALAEWMSGPGAGVALDDVAHTLNHHRARHLSFATVCARDSLGAVAGLQALASGRPADGVVKPHGGQCGPGTVFVYSGQGSQWPGMGRRLLADEPGFAAAVAELEPVFVEQVGFSLQQVIADGQAVAGDSRVQPVIMGLQLALTELWRSYGVTPDAVIGHSMGEVTAAVVAGALSPADGLRVIAVRSRLMSRLAGQGAVALLTLAADAVEDLIGDHPDVAVAGYVSPWQTVVAGPPARVDAVIAAVQSQNRFARRVNMEVASHTALMDPILNELRSELADLTPNTTAIPFISTVDDSTAAPLLDADYWVANVRRPVQLSQAVLTAADNHTTFVEISPHPMLTNAVTETLGAVHHHTLGTLSRDADDTVTFHTSLNTTHTTHPPVTPHPPEPHPVLPATPWQHTRHWMDLSPLRRTSTETALQSISPAGVLPADWNCELSWPSRPLAGVPAAVGSWLVVGQPALAAQLQRELGDGADVTVLDEDTPDTALKAALKAADHVVYAPAVPTVFDAAPGRRLFDVARRIAVVMARTADPGRLVFLTRNAQPVTEGDRANPAHAVLWGLGRTLALEHPEIWGAVIDLDELVPDRLAARLLINEAGANDAEDQVVYRDGMRRVARLRRTVLPQASGDGLDPAGSHLVVGATGNIGPHLVGQLVDMGATTVVAVSRNPGDRLRELGETLAARGATLVTVAADAADEDSMRAVFDRFGADLPPLAGIYLAAFGGGPVTLTEMTHDDVTAMFVPKLDAVAVLHNLSLTTDVRQFVLFSSISGVLGSRWLAHYTATTTFLDTFAYARRAAGLPATAVNWGLWKSLADNQSEHERQITMESGLEPMPDEVAIQALWSITAPGAPARSTVVAADWPRLAAAYRTRAALRIVDELLPAECTDEGADTPAAVPETEFRRELRTCPADERGYLLSTHVRALVASSMGLSNAQLVDPGAGFFQSGMDSLMSVTLKRELGESLGEILPASVIFDYPTVDGLTEYLATVLPEMLEVADQGDVDDYDGLSDDELLQQLSERLS